MSRTKYNNVLPYTRPVGASDKDAARALYLRDLRPICYKREERDKRVAAGCSIETLQDLAAKYDKGQQRFVPPARRKNLRNVEFLVAMIMDGEGRSDAVPPVWRIAVDLPKPHRRNSVAAALPFPSIDGSAQQENTASIHSISSLPRQKRYDSSETDTSFFFDPFNVPKACMNVNLWKDYNTSTDAERDAHLRKFHLRFQKLKSGEINANASVALNDYEPRKPAAEVDIWHRARKHIATLAACHGYLPSFHWSQSEVAKYELSHLVHDHSKAQAADTDGRTVRQERHSLSPEQLQLLYIYAMSLSAAECALLLAFCGVMGQSLARSGQICKMNRVHISYSEANLPVTPLFGPVRMLHPGDRGHHNVNKTADMAHWGMRTMKPSLACPWFGLALKTALDAKQRQGAQYEELLSQRTGQVVDKVMYRMAPLLSASKLLETDPLDMQSKPFRRVSTKDLIDIIAKALGKKWAWHCTSEEGQEDQSDQRLLHRAAELVGR
ncbi:TPA: hypothetical protein ACH3X1_013441 [Trebouxia sp. C0004]